MENKEKQYKCIDSLKISNVNLDIIRNTIFNIIVSLTNNVGNMLIDLEQLKDNFKVLDDDIKNINFHLNGIIKGLSDKGVFKKLENEKIEK